MTTLLIKGPGLEFQGGLAKCIGLNEAIILQQVMCLIDENKKRYKRDKQVWIVNSYEEWQEQFTFWSEVTVRRTIRSLERKGLLLSKVPSPFCKVKHYTVNYRKLKSLGFNNQTSFDSQTASDQNDQTTKSALRE